ncbi:MAG: hypothetical protein JRJ14_08435, partial [Deltaproteobacteria bacterium]|nr:hypothetical protein [Deltaproteobacteria bacterium]
MKDEHEPEEAFPYKPPDDNLKKKYQHIFALDHPLEDKLPKLFFDKVVGALALLLAFPILAALYLAYWIEGLIIPENKGPMFFSYIATS